MVTLSPMSRLVASSCILGSAAYGLMRADTWKKPKVRLSQGSGFTVFTGTMLAMVSVLHKPMGLPPLQAAPRKDDPPCEANEESRRRQRQRTYKKGPVV